MIPGPLSNNTIDGGMKLQCFTNSSACLSLSSLGLQRGTSTARWIRVLPKMPMVFKVSSLTKSRSMNSSTSAPIQYMALRMKETWKCEGSDNV